MTRSCCARPITRIINVAEFEAGLVGLDQALQNVYAAGLHDEAEIQRDLLKWVRDFGNHITPSRENDYKDALLNEFRKYVKKIGQESERNETRCRERGQRR